MSDLHPCHLPRLATVVAAAFLALACGSVHHVGRFDPAFTMRPGTAISVGTVSNQTGETFEIDIERMLRTALEEALAKSDHLSRGSGVEGLRLDAQILEYQRGNAFKRWLLPGWGTTVLSVQAELVQNSPPAGAPAAVSAGAGTRSGTGSGWRAGTVDARRTVSIGGAYSIGAWQSIMGKVAGDIVEELEDGMAP